MPRISLRRAPERTIEAEAGANLMTVLMDAGLPVASSCHGDGVCGKCGIFVEGTVTPLTPDEEGFRERGELPEGKRLACQCRILGNLCVDAPYW